MFSTKWNYKKFWQYVLPSVLSMLFISLYTIVDGIFVARFVGTQALAAVNLTYPIYNIGFAVAIMLSTGGSALISIALGEGDQEKANNHFSLVTAVIVASSLVIGLLGWLNIKSVLNILGVTPELYGASLVYGRILFITIVFLGVKVSYEYFLRVDDCANLSLLVTVIGGLVNMVLDYVFVAKFGWGIAGAGYATLLGVVSSSLIGAIHFIKNSKHIRYIRPKMDVTFLKEASLNGSSEMVTELSGAITAVLFNLALIKYAGSAGVAANSVLMYILFVFIAVSIGITMGIQPAISYSYGAKNIGMIKDIMKKSFVVMGSLSVVIFILIQLFGRYPVELFLKNDASTARLAVEGLYIFSGALLIAGINILGSGYFTAINQGKISAVISFSRSIVLLLPAILFLPTYFDLQGIWMAIPIAELGTVFLTVFFFSRDKIVRSVFSYLPI
jgi:putative MATE family efflux protein